jgi:lipid-A-disaccharide synthase
LLVVAGEPSADRAAARVVGELAARTAVPVFGIGGPLLAARGVELAVDARGLASIGPGDTLRRAAGWAAAWCAIREALRRRRPRAALLVDAPDFNLPLARVLSAAGIAVIQYVAPQVWAWRSGRLGLLRERADAVALVLPFEEELHRRAGVPAVYVGHPLLDESPPLPRAGTRRGLGLADGQPLVALLPGSRPGELERHTPMMLAAAVALRRHGVECVFAPPRDAAYASCIDRARHAGCLVPASGVETRDVLAAADAALVASGTATLEATLARTPHAAVYRVDPLSALAARVLLRAPYVALPSWIAGRRVVPELLQGRVTGHNLAAAALHLLDPAVADRQRADFEMIRLRLGPPGAAGRVARIVAGYLA